MRLEIYIANQCTNCEEALLIAERACGIAGLEVAVIDLDKPGQNVPTHVVAVPTYLLNGRVILRNDRIVRRPSFRWALQGFSPCVFCGSASHRYLQSRC